MRGGSRCLVLNLNLSFGFGKGKSFCTFLPHLKAYLRIRNTLILFGGFIWLLEQIEEVFLSSFYCNALCVLPWAGSRRLGLQKGFGVTVCSEGAAVQDWRSCPCAGTHAGRCCSLWVSEPARHESIRALSCQAWQTWGDFNLGGFLSIWFYLDFLKIISCKCYKTHRYTYSWLLVTDELPVMILFNTS